MAGVGGQLSHGFKLSSPGRCCLGRCSALQLKGDGPPLSWAPVPLGTPVWQSGWDLGSSPLPPSRLRANLAPHLAQMYPLLLAPRPTSGRALGCHGHPFPTLQSEGPLQNANSTMILPAADPSRGKVQGTGLAFKALHSSAPAHLSSLLFILSLPHSHTRAARILPIPLHQLFLRSGTPLLLLALFLPEYSCSFSKAQCRGPFSRLISPKSQLSLLFPLWPSSAHPGLLRLLS